jgi:hypothetical protein
MPERAVVDTSGWEPWQRDYRFGVILVMPPPDLASRIDALRQAYDEKSHAICPAHISVSDPLCRELNDAAREEIQESLRAVEPFEVHYDKLSASTQRSGVVYLVAPQQKFDELKRAIHRASVFDGRAAGRREIPAHMTIAEFVTIEDGLRICAELVDTAPRGSFWCDRLEYIVPDATFRFQRREAFSLGDR